MSTIYKAIGDRVIAKRQQRGEKFSETEGGLFIPEVARTKYAWATVVAVGEKVTSVKVGDQVMLHRLVGHENDTEHDGNELAFAREHELLAVKCDPYEVS